MMMLVISIQMNTTPTWMTLPPTPEGIRVPAPVAGTGAMECGPRSDPPDADKGAQPYS